METKVNRPGYTEGLALFQHPVTDVGHGGNKWVEYRPINQLTEGAPLEFVVAPTASTYIDLERTYLYVKAKLVKGDGTAIAKTELVVPSNLLLHTMFSQVDLSLQQTSVSQLGAHYPYKAYLDVLLNTVDSQELEPQMFFKDQIDMEDTNLAQPKNMAILSRYAVIHESKMFDMMGPLQLDMAQQDRYLLNGVPLTLKLWPSSDKFRIMASDATQKYKVLISDASLKVCHVKINPNILIAQNELLKSTPALYPYQKSNLKTFSLPAGQFSFTADDLFQGEVPTSLILGIVSSSAYNGDYGKNPFNFKNYDCNFVGFYVNGESVPTHPYTPNYRTSIYLDLYQTLNHKGSSRAVPIGRADYGNGYSLYRFEFVGDTPLTSPSMRGHTRLELKFGTALPETCTVIVYAKFAALMKVDQARSISLL